MTASWARSSAATPAAAAGVGSRTGSTAPASSQQVRSPGERCSHSRSTTRSLLRSAPAHCSSGDGGRCEATAHSREVPTRRPLDRSGSTHQRRSPRTSSRAFHGSSRSIMSAATARTGHRRTTCRVTVEPAMSRRRRRDCRMCLVRRRPLGPRRTIAHRRRGRRSVHRPRWRHTPRQSHRHLLERPLPSHSPRRPTGPMNVEGSACTQRLSCNSRPPNRAATPAVHVSVVTDHVASSRGRARSLLSMTMVARRRGAWLSM
jgi:hypothetical protein